MRIVVMNPNTSASMTAGIDAAATAAASPGTEIVAVAPLYGPEAIDSASESYLSAVSVRLAEAVLGMGLSTSRVCTYAAPAPNAISHWPLSKSITGLA